MAKRSFLTGLSAAASLFFFASICHARESLKAEETQEPSPRADAVATAPDTVGNTETDSADAASKGNTLRTDKLLKRAPLVVGYHFGTPSRAQDGSGSSLGFQMVQAKLSAPLFFASKVFAIASLEYKFTREPAPYAGISILFAPPHKKK